MDRLDPTLVTTPSGPTMRRHVPERQSRRLVTLFYAKVFPVLAAAGVLFVLFIIGGKAVEGYQLRQEAKALQQHIDQLQKDNPVSYTHLRAHETRHDLVCRLLLE